MPQSHTATIPIAVVLPAGVPVLAAGAHDRSEQGACFMEYASVLAGERFSDHPRCTHPVLAAACRAINDHISDGGRQRLVTYVPDVVGTRTRDPRVSAALVLTCADAAEGYAPGRFILARSEALQRLSRAARGGWSRRRVVWTERDYCAAAAKAVGEAVSAIAPHGGDSALHKLLIDLLDAYRGTTNPAEFTAERPDKGNRLGHEARS
jgi:hypothetical protein